MNRDCSARLLRCCLVLFAWLAAAPLFAQSLPFFLAPGKPSPVADPPYVFDYVPTLVPEHDAWTWWDADYLLEWMKSPTVPALVTTGPTTVLGPSGSPGVPGQPGTVTLLGGKQQNMGAFTGGRFLFGCWMNDDQCFGMECGSFFLLQQRVDSTAGSTGSPPLSVPFFNVNAGAPDSAAIASTVAVPSFGGTANLTLQTQVVGVDGTFVYGAVNKDGFRLDFLGGFRWVKLDDTLQFLTNSSTNPPFTNEFFATQDRFQVHNNFYGANFGVRSEWCWHNWLLNASGKIAFGDNQQTSRITGGLATNVLDGLTTVQTFPGGYLTGPSNLGFYRRNAFAVLPEFNIKAGYAVAKCCRVYVGYNVWLLSSVARAANQVDPYINPTQSIAFSALVPQAQINNGLGFPAYRGNSTDFWTQGLTFGVEFRY